MIPLAIGLAAANTVAQDMREKRSNENQEQMLDIQWRNQRDLNQQGHNLQYEMWKKTNYSAQMEQMRKAGLSPGLMYGQSGAGGATTGSQGGGSAASGNAAAPQQMEIGAMMQAAQAQKAQIELLDAQKKNIDADTANKKAGTEYTSGAQTAKTEAETKTEGHEAAIKYIESKYAEQKESWGATKIENESRQQQVQANVAQNTAESAEKKIEAEAKNESIQSAIMMAEKEIKEFEARLTRDGISPNSPWYAKLLKDFIEKMGIMDLIRSGQKEVKSQIKN